MYPLSSLQQQYLSSLVKNRRRVSIHLKNGIHLKGRITGYGEKVLFLHESHVGMVFFHTIIAIVPQMDWKDYARQREQFRQVRQEKESIETTGGF